MEAGQGELAQAIIDRLDHMDEVVSEETAGDGGGGGPLALTLTWPPGGGYDVIGCYSW